MIERKGPCDNCGSSDAKVTYADHTHCFSCGQHTITELNKNEDARVEAPRSPADIRGLPAKFEALADRGISAATARKYGVAAPDGDTRVKHVYPYYSNDGQHLANKIRGQVKGDFRWEGDVRGVGLFGQQLFPAGSAKSITLVEGECDALAAYEMHGSRYPVVSVKNGADGAARDVANSFEYLNSFGTIVVCFDKDEGKVQPTGEIRYPGQEAAVAVANMFPIGKVKILTLSQAKDANDYLLKGWADKFRDEWWKAPTYTPTGLKLGKDMWDEIVAPKNFETVSYPWQGANYHTYGIRLSELVVITADSGVGKTKYVSEIEHHILDNTPKDRGIGLLHLEEPNQDTALGLMSITANKPLHLPDVREAVTNDELRRYFDRTINNDRIVIWDHFGSNSIHEVLSKIRHMHNLGCKYIILDHLSIVVSDQSGDERKQLDEITTKIKTLCMELNIAVIAVIHQNRAGQIRGTAGVEQLANIVFKLHRQKDDPDVWRRNVTKVVVEKNRFCGRTGPACYLYYDEFTGRLRELSPEEVKQYESGASSLEEEWKDFANA